MALPCSGKVETNGGAGIAVALNDKSVIKPGFLNPQTKPARSGKKFD